MIKVLFLFSQTWLGGLLLGWLFAHFSFAIPINRILETDTLVVFHHPQPSYPLHILLVPKRNYKAVVNVSADDVALMLDIFEAVKKLVARYRLEESGYRLITNGGNAQDIPHLHFHLIGDDYE